MSSMRVCFLVNPFAGAGGRLGWKGTDWPLPLKLAEKKPEELPAWRRAERFLKKSKEFGIFNRTEWFAPHGVLGGDLLEKIGASYTRVECWSPRWPSRPEDTLRCAKASVHTCQILVFVGGDGTARLIAEAVNAKMPTLGVPAGVKVYSSVFAESPEAAALILREFIEGRTENVERLVLDIDEEAFRSDRLSVKPYGYLLVPVVRNLVVDGKQAYHPAGEIEEMREIAQYIVDEIAKPCTLLILGPGSTVYEVKRMLGIRGSLLGVDLVHNNKIIVKDANEDQILNVLNTGSWKSVKIIVTPIGGQGFFLGRGNQQISPRVIRKVGYQNVLVIATPTKLRSLNYLRVDTGDPEVDALFRGHIKVVTGYNRFRIMRVK